MKPYRAKKSLGQNFLKSELALKKIVEAGDIKPDDIILEIGPGKGALTSKLLEKAKTVIAVEKDRELFEFLNEKFSEQIKSGSLVLINDDILKFDIAKVVRQDLTTYKLIANIPYNITGAVLRKFLSAGGGSAFGGKKFLTAQNQPELMVLMVQHEVAQRIVARDGKESILSISVKAYGEPKTILKVPKRYFSPAPKVDSAVIAIKNISREFFIKNITSPLPSPSKGEGGKETIQDKTLNSRAFEEKFWEIVKAGFAHKRKKLSSNLKSTKYGAVVSVSELGNKRAEDLTLLDWLALAR